MFYPNQTKYRQTILTALLCGLFIVSSQAEAEVKAEFSVGVVRSIIDGDTLEIEVKGKAEHLRLIGIDAPEMHDNEKARRDLARSAGDLATLLALGRRSKIFLAALVSSGSSLKIEFDSERRDRFGRLLGYCYLSDGRMLNEVLVASGYASLMTIPPNVRYVDRFKKAYKQAQANKLGLWR